MNQPQYDNTNSGALFKNTEKTPENPTWADYNGSINVNGQEFWLNAWIKKSKKGQTFMSLAVKPKEQQKQRPVAEYNDSNAPFDDEIPF